LGAICRTAHALGITGVLISGGVDIYSPKVQRASMGSMLKIPVIQIDEIRQFIEELKLKKMRVYASTPNDGALDINKADFKNGTVCVIGNEANGVSESTQDICDGLITVKMKGKAESLNASSAASIIMWEMMR
jgi:TrmH family RNA methyltransferase